MEEWFYLLIPVILFISVGLFRLSVSKAILFAAFIVIVVVTGFRWYRIETLEIELNTGYWDILFRKQVSTRLDALMFGVIGAYFAFYATGLWLKYKKQLFVLGLILLFGQQAIVYFEWYSFDVYYCVFSFTINSLATVLLIPFLSTMKPFKGRAYRFFARISVLSYGMYLTNLSLVMLAIMQPLPWDQWIFADFWMNFFQFATYWLLTIGFSILLYKYVELPMMKLRDAPVFARLFKLTLK